MAWRCGSLSRSLISTARSSSIRSTTTTSLLRLRPPPIPAVSPQSRRLYSITNLGTIGGVLGCTQSLLPLHSVVAASRLTSHISAEARACCELSQVIDEYLPIARRSAYLILLYIDQYFYTRYLELTTSLCKFGNRRVISCGNPLWE